MNALFRMILLAAIICGPCPVPAQTEAATVIPANLAASHVGEYITVEGVVAKIFTSKSGNTFLNIGAACPNQTFTGWIPPASPVSKSLILPGIEREARDQHPSDREQRSQGSGWANSLANSCSCRWGGLPP